MQDKKKRNTLIIGALSLVLSGHLNTGKHTYVTLIQRKYFVARCIVKYNVCHEAFRNRKHVPCFYRVIETRVEV